MSPAKPADVVSAFLDAFSARDFERVRNYLSDESFSYQSPIDTFSDADTFIASMSRVGPILERIERTRTFVDGNVVCSVLMVHTTMDMLKGVIVVHVATVVDGRITVLESVFDATEYNKMIVPPDEAI